MPATTTEATKTMARNTMCLVEVPALATSAMAEEQGGKGGMGGSGYGAWAAQAAGGIDEPLAPHEEVGLDGVVPPGRRAARSGGRRRG